jgi:hypothetical protein
MFMIPYDFMFYNGGGDSIRGGFVVFLYYALTPGPSPRGRGEQAEGGRSRFYAVARMTQSWACESRRGRFFAVAQMT